MEEPSIEHSLLHDMSSYFNSNVNKSFVVETGDDAAVRVCKAGEKLIYTADVLVEDIHFSRKYMSMKEIGYKSIVASVSDCASMGADVDSVLIQLTFPKDKKNIKDDILELYRGVEKACKRWDFSVVGGDLSAGSCWSIAVSLTGKIEKDKRVLLRTGAKIGDGLWVSGEPGSSAAGLEILATLGREKLDSKYTKFIDAHIAPFAQIDLGKKLAGDITVTTLTDISDGVAKECRTLAFENSLGVKLHQAQFPIFKDIQKLSAELNRNSVDWFLSGGEDYELLFTASKEFNESHYEIPLYQIGEVVEGSGVVIIDEHGEVSDVDLGGWDHFVV